MVHKLKLQARFMDMKIMGVKKYELRVDDRGYGIGDFVHYVEVDDNGMLETYQRYARNLYWIDSILTHDDFALIPEGCVIWNESEAINDPACLRDALLHVLNQNNE